MLTEQLADIRMSVVQHSEHIQQLREHTGLQMTLPQAVAKVSKPRRKKEQEKRERPFLACFLVLETSDHLPRQARDNHQTSNRRSTLTQNVIINHQSLIINRQSLIISIINHQSSIINH